ncbi:MFS transporter, FSR family, fosmidomycin resistance protein [Paenibacillus barengoltzii J12]|uniref:MFS transporter, FSR family, fosmidomycin resistance protein n=1 Tax=Paenibacillus barengoltzii J12 TaxID=935846 RepID=A0ABY1M279_9BACL|nr:MFS transporter [Paenibacillus barengoltzii]SMF58873.1 MFS transporter, FSR family, fosmidomycin resistance protein [Paenibacillus barengoltzii J12]
MNQSTAVKSANPVLTVYPILFAISTVHLLNDTMQSAIPALFPVLRESLLLSYGQIGWISFAMNMTASLFQPLVGLYSDVRPRPYILPLGVCFTLAGIVMLAFAPSYPLILLAVTSIGLGSSVFHPESSRVAYLAAGPRRGLAQSIFQVGGNIGASLGPIMSALIFIPLGQTSVAWFALAAVAAIVIQFFVAKWYSGQDLKPRKVRAAGSKAVGGAARPKSRLSRGKIMLAITVLVLLLFSKNVYSISISTFYSFFLMDHYGVAKDTAQWYIFAFLAASAVGTFFGGPIADRYGRRNIIWVSILGTAPFSLLLPYANLFWSGVLVVIAGLIMSSAFSIIVVYAQELLPGKVGLISGLFFGLSFGLGGLGSAVLGNFADQAGILFIMQVCSLLPLIGLLTVLLPKDEALKQQEAGS